jgi:hypothetical protein
MKARIRRTCLKIAEWLYPRPKPDYSEENRALRSVVAELQSSKEIRRQADLEFAAEMIEAQQMRGLGPWRTAESQNRVQAGIARLREADPILSQGAFGDIDLALQNVEWRRQVNLSWLEFSRWGIQQIILISRLYYIKHPIVRRLIDVVSAYVFARGVEVTTDDDAANDTLAEFFAENQSTMGQNALAAAERAKDTDGNLFWAFFADRTSTGKVKVRTIDPCEISEIVCDPDDVDTPQYYHRVWDQRNFDPVAGATQTVAQNAWYPALGYEPAERPATIGQSPVMWESPVLHRKCGAVAKWHFGCPRIYPMLDWAREARRFLEACASVRQSLSQIAMTLTTKGGQQALEGAKEQISTTVGPTSQIWDTNPPAIRGATFASGPGTKLEAFKTSGAGFSPEDVRQYKLMCCMVSGVPETFLGDVSTGNLATATSLDRPTETVFLEKQESWREDLATIATFVLNVSKGATGGRLKEARGTGVKIVECRRRLSAAGSWVYEAFAKKSEGKEPIKVQVNFPAIREGDMPAIVKAIVSAMTLENRGGQIVGIDEKAGVKELYRAIGIEEGEELAELQYPDKEYDPDRSEQEVTAPIGKSKLSPGGTTQINPKTGELSPESLQKAIEKLDKATQAFVESQTR